ncbi:pentapeptide repeat-containing protein [Rossellomorea aquimaris]|uniref:pentapeptide repeat-containing protein n=1 Tax=Rossellomorea aquimaris TaxID=189382 RepID=UPI001CD73858|nr:pentapeptide repeat-containing protein [Rossellomorea aquimaris]MCA1055760.1 pentapeptide repeat-containing protein [Rossellomorea aquimaris]
MLQHIKIENPKLPTDLKRAQFEDLYYEEDPSLMDCEVKNAFVEGENIEKLELSRVSFKGIRLLSSTFSRADVADVIFEGCDLSNTRFDEGILHRVAFKDCKLLGLDLSKAHLKDVTFDNCIMDVSSFIETMTNKVRFERSRMHSANFYECDMKRTAFEQCDLNDIDFTVTNLNGVDISSSFFERINVEAANVKGCIVSPQQAVSFASLLGLKVKE